MVKSVSNLSRSGLRDWLIQQLSAAFMTVYVLALVIYLWCHPATDFYAWHHLFSYGLMRVVTLIFFGLLIIHAWVGLWTVATDYLKKTSVRLIFLLAVFFVLTACMIWTIQILWGL